MTPKFGPIQSGCNGVGNVVRILNIWIVMDIAGVNQISYKKIMEEITKYILSAFRFTEEGISMEKVLEFKAVKSRKNIMAHNKSHTENELDEITVELENGETATWFSLSQGWGGGDDADDWIYIYDNLAKAKAEYLKFDRQ